MKNAICWIVTLALVQVLLSLGVYLFARKYTPAMVIFAFASVSSAATTSYVLREELK